MSVSKRVADLYDHGGISGVVRGSLRYLKHRVKNRYVYIVLSGKLNTTRARRDGFEAVADPFVEREVPTEEIRYLGGSFGKRGHDGAVYGGTWDRDRVPMDETTKYRGIEQRYIEQRPWEDTDIFDEYGSLIESGGQKDGFWTREGLRKRYEAIDELHGSIVEKGLLNRRERPLDDTPFDDILINVARDGTLLFNGNGWHRLSIAKVLDIEKIPVRIYVRHTGWQRTRDAIAAGEPIPDELTGHPDLEDVRRL